MSIAILTAAAADLQLEPRLTEPEVSSKWLDPQLSIGERCHPLGRNQCWEVIGPAREASKSIFPATKTLLESRCDFINGDERVQPLIIFGMFMIGRNEKKACPTLLFSCELKGPRRRAIQLAKGEELLKTFPFIKIAESARPPVALQVPRLLVSLNTVTDGIEGSRSPRRSIYYLPREQTCGTLIAQAYDDNLNGPKATLGGIVQMQEQYFGLTAGHVFSDTYTPPSFSGKCDSEFAFDGESDEISDEEDLTAVTSSGSISSDADEASACLSPFNSQSQTPSQDDMTTNIFDHQVIHPRSPTRDSQKGPLFAPSQDWKYIGNLVQPLQEPDDGSDWALIEIKNWEIPLENVVDSGKGDTPCQLHPRKIAPQNPQENEVIVATGLSGNLKGKVSGTPVNMLWPSSTEIQEFWIVRLEQNLEQGNSGSWVVDANNGDLFGHIVAGHPDSTTAYMTLAEVVFSRIETAFGKPVRLLSDKLAPNMKASHISFQNRDTVLNLDVNKAEDRRPISKTVGSLWRTLITFTSIQGLTSDITQKRLRTQEVAYHDAINRLYFGVLNSKGDSSTILERETLVWSNDSFLSRLEARLGEERWQRVKTCISDLTICLEQTIAKVETMLNQDRAVAMKQRKITKIFSSERLQTLETLQSDLQSLVSTTMAGSSKKATPGASSSSMSKNHRKALDELDEALLSFYNYRCAKPQTVRLGLAPLVLEPSNRNEDSWTGRNKLIIPLEEAHIAQTPSPKAAISSLVISESDFNFEAGFADSRSWGTARRSKNSSTDNSQTPSTATSISTRPSLASSAKIASGKSLRLAPLPAPMESLDQLAEIDNTSSRAIGTKDSILIEAVNYLTKTNTSVDSIASTIVHFEQEEFEVALDAHPYQSRPPFVGLNDYIISKHITRNERLFIAVALGQAILELYGTAWLDYNWSCKNFDIEHDRIYVKRSFGSGAGHPKTLSASTSEFWDLIGEPVLTRLGYALCEVALGRTLADLADAEVIPGSPDSEMLELITARSIVDSGMISEVAGKQYNDAVQACLTHQWVRNNEIIRLSSKNSDFTQQAEPAILRPLLETYRANWVGIGVDAY